MALRRLLGSLQRSGFLDINRSCLAVSWETNFQPGHFGGHDAFEAMLNKRTAAQKALIEDDADRRLGRALGLVPSTKA